MLLSRMCCSEFIFHRCRVRGKWIPNKNKKVLLTNMVAKSPCEECKAAKMEKLNWQQKAGEMNARNAVLETAVDYTLFQCLLVKIAF